MIASGTCFGGLPPGHSPERPRQLHRVVERQNHSGHGIYAVGILRGRTSPEISSHPHRQSRPVLDDSAVDHRPNEPLPAALIVTVAIEIAVGKPHGEAFVVVLVANLDKGRNHEASHGRRMRRYAKAGGKIPIVRHSSGFARGGLRLSRNRAYSQPAQGVHFYIEGRPNRASAPAQEHPCAYERNFIRSCCGRRLRPEGRSRCK